jgi:hypothetical protein
MGTGVTIQTGGGGGKRKSSSSSSTVGNSYYTKNQNTYKYGIVTEINENDKIIAYTPLEDRTKSSGGKKGTAYPFYGKNQNVPQIGSIVPLVSGPSLQDDFSNDLSSQYNRTTYYLDPVNFQGTINANVSIFDNSNEGTNTYQSNELGFSPNSSGPSRKISYTAAGYKTAYPELQFTDPPPPPDELSYKAAVAYLKTKYGDDLGKAVFAVLIAEAAKNKERTAFISAGGHNYAGVQTDNARWSAPGIVGQYSRIDSGNVRRSFAIFENDQTFLDFTADRLKAKGFSGVNGDIWTSVYINKWWSPANKASYTKGTSTYNDKLAIFNTASNKFNQFSV